MIKVDDTTGGMHPVPLEANSTGPNQTGIFQSSVEAELYCPSNHPPTKSAGLPQAPTARSKNECQHPEKEQFSIYEQLIYRNVQQS